MYRYREDAEQLKPNTKVLAKCPKYCNAGLSVLLWDGKRFIDESCPLEPIDHYVVSFIELHNGKPLVSKTRM